jgi:hypothetical protein
MPREFPKNQAHFDECERVQGSKFQHPQIDSNFISRI